jgi:uncharacterized protein YndB with AHSA1/START domain
VGSAIRVARNQRFIDAPPERVFAVLADPDSYAEWVVGSREIRDADDGFPEPGTRFHHSIGIWPLIVRDHTEVLEADPPRLLRLEAKARPLGQATVTLALAAERYGTRVTMIEDPSGYTMPLKFVPLTHLVTRVRNAESLRRLAELVERSA